MRAACALALSDHDDARWAKVGDEVVRCLAGEKILELRDWANLLEPIKKHLVAHEVRRLVQADAAGFAGFLAMVSTYPDDAPAILQAQLKRTLPATATSHRLTKMDATEATAGFRPASMRRSTPFMKASAAATYWSREKSSVTLTGTPAKIASSIAGMPCAVPGILMKRFGRAARPCRSFAAATVLSAS